MEHKESGRHLAAILFTDIVGYTAMMQRDEALALSAVRRHQEVLERLVPLHEGEVYQYYGDGSLNIFHSAIQAVKAALEIQKELLMDPPVLLKIGVHIGEIYTENGKIFGDGVNIASRIESIGQGGTVLLSRDVYEKVRNHGLFQLASVGKFEFKNVDEPVEVFALTNSGLRELDRKNIEGKLKELAPKQKSKITYALIGLIPILAFLYMFFIRHQISNDEAKGLPVNQSIAVLPFQNLSDGKEEDFLSTGIAEDILTQLAQIHDLKVISRTSTMQYKDSDKPIKIIAKELKVTSILEGSVRKYENNLRVSVQLTNAANESLIWAADFDRQIEDVLNVQRDVALAVSNNLKIALSPQLKNRLQNKVNVNPEAYINYQKGEEILHRSSGTREDMDKALAYFELSVQQDSNFAQAWIGMSEAYTEFIFWHRLSPASALPKAKAAAERALSIDPQLGDGYGALGTIEFIEHRYEDSEKNLRKAIEYNPNYPYAYENLGWIMVYRKRFEDALAYFNRCVELDPMSTRFKGSIGNAYAVAGRYEEGITVLQDFLKDDPKDNYLLWTLGFLYAGKGDCDKAIEILNQRTIGTKTNWVLTYCYAKTGQRDKAEEILNNNIEKSKTEMIPDFMMAVQYCALGQYDKALDHLEKVRENKAESFFEVGLEKDPFLVPLHDHPRYKKLVMEIKKEFKFN
ncbi:MAG TPA: tetratricopeptide repeat protein [Saprospiraceae bacterium]|nr:tetratricopeptide repeat protein [Saprospiraceae bacterium]